ncbi:unnamed protein product (macronuclear) [Paramecium tetraurelia]|uniref:Uncharacterized protein n=1 Tax=Paramecium tetraurelia TaxID=5888 RepID=A0CVR5_PARTE|nr:uncharacterized protein GSPATT00039043001 [Paramecium tetraurelia]CAK74882.1 unnamed protein product [Paramecium tetraurelia]|eukprot:XP_001442279.1 hypothetical protein (macronuclear) [Paramecium tetraurelia strain d4-2]
MMNRINLSLVKPHFLPEKSNDQGLITTKIVQAKKRYNSGKQLLGRQIKINITFQEQQEDFSAYECLTQKLMDIINMNDSLFQILFFEGSVPKVENLMSKSFQENLLASEKEKNYRKEIDEATQNKNGCPLQMGKILYNGSTSNNQSRNLENEDKESTCLCKQNQKKQFLKKNLINSQFLKDNNDLTSLQTFKTQMEQNSRQQSHEVNTYNFNYHFTMIYNNQQDFLDLYYQELEKEMIQGFSQEGLHKMGELKEENYLNQRQISERIRQQGDIRKGQVQRSVLTTR